MVIKNVRNIIHLTVRNVVRVEKFGFEAGTSKREKFFIFKGQTGFIARKESTVSGKVIVNKGHTKNCALSLKKRVRGVIGESRINIVHDKGVQTGRNAELEQLPERDRYL